METEGEGYVRRIIDGDVVSQARLGGFFMKSSSGLPDVETVFGEGSRSRSQLIGVVEVRVSEDIESFVEEEAGNGYRQLFSNEGVSEKPRSI